MLAIVIPYYKLSSFEATLKSLALQSDQRFKVYIGNDASTENPETLLDTYKSQLDIVYHKFSTNLGGTSLVKQWDRCINLIADETWLMILGDDDYLGEHVVKTFYEQYNSFKTKANVVRFASQMVFDTTNTKSKVYTHPVWEDAITSHMRKYDGASRSSLSEHIFKTESYKKQGFVNYPLAWFSDDKAWIDFSENKPIYTINDSMVYIRVSNESISGKKSNIGLKQESAIQFYRNVIDEKSQEYPKALRLRLFLIYEIIIKRKRKLVKQEWQFLFKKYVQNFSLIPFLKLIRRILVSKK
ncbi:glycosyltransferase family 2 protein [Lacinutrix algicola]|uniref:glycosyltransferase family 2 protein n=1 Tax=Lacinutrix algicola TaxID=342954 RepID=UPI0006E43316|nr:glycosyltransferase family 2 protein [Lacinutrix algicola]